MRTLAVAAILAVSRLAAAQTCNFALCPSGWEYTGGGSDASGPYGSCKHCSGFPTFACSHTLQRCPSGSTLNPSTGFCTWNLCSGGCGGELPLCEADETYTGSGTDASGLYGSCKHCLGFPTFACSHTLERCREGWTLQPATGMCRKDCLPDLVIKFAWLRDQYGSVVSTVRAGRPYYICADVKNVGLSSSGSCTLAGGGLGVPYTPSASVPALGASASVTRCLYYASAPSPGTWNVGLTVDSTNAVAESSNANNTYTVPVTVTP